MSNTVFSRSTAALIAFCTPCGLAALLASVWPIVHEAGTALAAPSRAPDRIVEHAVVAAAAAALTVVGGWLLVSCVVCWVGALRRGAAALDESGWFRPRFLQVLAVTIVSALVVSGTQAATAARAPARHDAELLSALDGLTVPDRAYGGVRTHRVVSGESLWSVSEAVLRPAAPDVAVARTWRRLHRLNLDRVGTDPDVLHPGTTLRLPAWASVPTQGASR